MLTGSVKIHQCPNTPSKFWIQNEIRLLVQFSHIQDMF